MPVKIHKLCEAQSYVPGSDDEAVSHGARHLATALGTGVGALVVTWAVAGTSHPGFW